MDFSALKTKISTIGLSLKRLGKAEVAEALLTTWAIEFLRLRKIGAIRPAEVIVVSLLSVIIKTILNEASRRKKDDRRIVVSSWASQMEPMGYQRDLFGSRRQYRSRRPKKYPY